MSENIELSVVVLCYRSEEEIIPYAQKVKDIVSAHTDSYEIVLVGNYILDSSDRTKEIVEQIAREDPVFKTICKPKKGMMGWDMKEGLSFAAGDFLCVIDGDGQFPVEAISECYQRIKTGKYGLVKTYREKRYDGLQRKIVSVVYNWVFSILFPRVKAKDINSKPKMFLREAFDRMNLTYDDWFIDAEIMIKISRMNIPFYEFPIEFLALKGRTSFVNFSTILEFIRNLIIYRLKSE